MPVRPRLRAPNQLSLHRLHNRISRLNERKLKSPAFDEHVAATVSPVLSRGGRTLLRVSRDYVVSAITAKFFRLGVAISPTLRSPGAIDTVAHRAIWQTNIVHRSAASKAGHKHQEKYAHCDVNLPFFVLGRIKLSHSQPDNSGNQP